MSNQNCCGHFLKLFGLSPHIIRNKALLLLSKGQTAKIWLEAYKHLRKQAQLWGYIFWVGISLRALLNHLSLWPFRSQPVGSTRVRPGMPGKGACAHGRGLSTPTPRRKLWTVLGLPVDRAVRPVLLLSWSPPAPPPSAAMRPGYAQQVLWTLPGLRTGPSLLRLVTRLCARF